MSYLEEVVQDIDNKKDEITRAIALAFADGDEKKANSFYNSFFNYISASKFFILRTLNLKSSYEKDIDLILDELESYLGYSIKNLFYRDDQNAFSLDFFKANVTNINFKDLKKLEKIYSVYQDLFMKLEISYQKFIDVYKQYGFVFVEVIKKLHNKIQMKEFKNKISIVKDYAEFVSLSTRLFYFVDEYNISSLEDLQNFYVEVSSFFVNEDLLSEKEKIIINQNKIKFQNRNENFITDIEDIKSLKIIIEKFFNSQLIKAYLEKSNIGDFFSKYNIPFTYSNYMYFYNIYNKLFNYDGLNFYFELNGNFQNITILNETLLSKSQEDRDVVVIHELIHSLNKMKKNKVEILFSKKCNYFDEALTEYFAQRALSFMKSQITKNKNCEKEDVKYESIYKCMFPLIEILENSKLWDDIVNCKISDDYLFIFERIGNDIERISKMFTKVFYSNSSEVTSKTAKELQLLVDKIEQSNPRYNKYHSI